MRYIAKVINDISCFCEVVSLRISGIALCTMTFLAFGGVVFRYVFEMPLNWAEELLRFFLVIFAFFCISYGVKKKKHIGITFILDRFPDKYRHFIKVFGIILMIIFCIVLFFSGIKLVTLTHTQTSPILNFPIFVIYLIIPLNAIIMFIHLVNDIIISCLHSKYVVTRREVNSHE